MRPVRVGRVTVVPSWYRDCVMIPCNTTACLHCPAVIRPSDVCCTCSPVARRILAEYNSPAISGPLPIDGFLTASPQANRTFAATAPPTNVTAALTAASWLRSISSESPGQVRMTKRMNCSAHFYIVVFGTSCRSPHGLSAHQGHPVHCTRVNDLIHIFRC